MTAKGPKLDKATTEIARRLLSTPPKPHETMKVGRPGPKKERDPKGRAASSKPQNA